MHIDASEPHLRIAIEACGGNDPLASLRAELSGLAERMTEVEENLSEGLATATAERGSLSSQVGNCRVSSNSQCCLRNLRLSSHVVAFLLCMLILISSAAACVTHSVDIKIMW